MKKEVSKIYYATIINEGCSAWSRPDRLIRSFNLNDKALKQVRAKHLLYSSGCKGKGLGVPYHLSGVIAGEPRKSVHARITVLRIFRNYGDRNEYLKRSTK